MLRLLDGDLSVTAIAANLYLSPNTVRTHTRALYRKLGVNTRADAVARAAKLGLRGPNAITHVILHSSAVRQRAHAQCSGACPVGSTDSRSRAS